MTLISVAREQKIIHKKLFFSKIICQAFLKIFLLCKRAFCYILIKAGYFWEKGRIPHRIQPDPMPAGCKRW